MSLLQRIDAQRDAWAKKPSARAFLTGPAVVDRSAQAFGHDNSQYTPTEYGHYLATSNGVYACATGRADLLASLPLKIYRLDAQGKRTEVTAGRLYALLQKVNPHWTITRLLEMIELSLCLWGQAFLFLERGESGLEMPREIWWARPDRVKVVPDPTNYIAGYLYTPANGGQPIPYRPSEVIWFRFPNPNDEFSGLSPLAAARLAADYATEAMQSNRGLFRNGMQIGGVVAPKTGSGTVFSDEQADELADLLERRFKGANQAHRWAVLRFEAQLQANTGLSPKDAEFLGGLKWALEDICRAYKWPQDLVGGQRTYENYDAALRAAWTHCVLPEAGDLARELGEQLLPMFPGEADLVEFDSSGVAVLREAETAAWTRDEGRIYAGAMTINEYREAQGKPKVPWGDVWWAPAELVPVMSADIPAPAPAEDPPPAGDDPRGLPAPRRALPAPSQTRDLDYGGEEHRRLWDRFVGRATKQEQSLGKVVAELLRRQKESVLAKLRAGRAGGRGIEDNPFDLAEWIRKFRTEVRPQVKRIVGDAGDEALDDLELQTAFDVSEPRVVRFIEGRAQRFARRVNETTWDQLKASLAAGVAAGESIDDLADRVESVMGARINSSAETIARTEVIGASNGGTLEAWRQSEVVEGKQWLSALDDRVRDTHRDAHGQTVGLDEDFEVGDATGPGPGLMGAAEEDVNCRCTVTAKVSERLYRTKFGANGHKERVYA